jgi:PAS domain S-box-containing protein
MANFKENTVTKLGSTIQDKKICFKEGDPIDFIAIYNQSHLVGRWDYIIGQNCVIWSPEVYAIHGLEPSGGTVEIDRAIRYYHQEDAESLSKLLAQAIRMKTGFTMKLRLARADGALRVVEATGAPVVDKAGTVMRMVGTFRDVTSQTEYENLRQSNTDLLLRTIRSLPVSAALLDRQLRYIAWSGQWMADFNLPPDADLKGRDFRELLQDVAAPLTESFGVALRGNPVGRDNMRLERATGVSHVVDWRMQPWHDARQNIGGVLIMIHVKYTGMPRAGGLPNAGLALPDRSGDLKSLIK